MRQSRAHRDPSDGFCLQAAIRICLLAAIKRTSLAVTVLNRGSLVGAPPRRSADAAWFAAALDGRLADCGTSSPG